jgi:hypothetical protein
MRCKKLKVVVLAVGLASAVGVAAQSEVRSIDVRRSVLKIRVFKSGLFSAFAHNHEIEAPIAQGRVELSESPSVTLLVDARKLRVLDPGLSADKRVEVQKTMDGPQVLDSSRFPEISFRSTAIEKMGADHWTVRGNLTLHGQTRPVAVQVALRDGDYRGSATLKQRDFGIAPVSIAGGTVKVKDEVKIEFDIILAK